MCWASVYQYIGTGGIIRFETVAIRKTGENGSGAPIKPIKNMRVNILKVLK